MGFMIGGREQVLVIEPPMRACFEPATLHIPKRLKQTMRKSHWQFSTNQKFETVIRYCSRDIPPTRLDNHVSHQKGSTSKSQNLNQSYVNDDGVWITDYIKRSFCALHQRGFAHSLEVWQDRELAGGIYGLALGGVFFGESMFHLKRDASKIALVQLVLLVEELGFKLFDCQFLTPHLARFGAREFKKSDFSLMLVDALQQKPADFETLKPGPLKNAT